MQQYFWISNEKPMIYLKAPHQKHSTTPSVWRRSGLRSCERSCALEVPVALSCAQYTLWFDVICSYPPAPGLIGPDLMRNRDNQGALGAFAHCIFWSWVWFCASINHLPSLDVMIYIALLIYESVYFSFSPSPGFPRDRHLLEFRWCIGQLRCHLEISKRSTNRSDRCDPSLPWMQCEICGVLIDMLIVPGACARNASSTTGLFLLWSYLRTRSLKPSSLL